MLNTRAQGRTEGGVTFVDFFPASVVTWMLPSSVPAQSTLMLRGEGENAVIDPVGAGVTVLAYLPVLAGTDHVCRSSAGLMRVQEWPRSLDLNTTFCT